MVEAGSNEGSRSILDRIKNLLQFNPSVFFAGETSFLSTQSRRKSVDGTSIFVAPVNPTFNLQKLNEFMRGLTPDVNPSSSIDAKSFFDRFPIGGLELGRLCFDEKYRKIEVIVFPEPYSAAMAYSSERQGHALPFRKELDPYQVRKLRKLHRKKPQEVILKAAREICQSVGSQNHQLSRPFLIKNYRTY